MAMLFARSAVPSCEDGQPDRSSSVTSPRGAQVSDLVQHSLRQLPGIGGTDVIRHVLAVGYIADRQPRIAKERNEMMQRDRLVNFRKQQGRRAYPTEGLDRTAARVQAGGCADHE